MYKFKVGDIVDIISEYQNNLKNLKVKSMFTVGDYNAYFLFGIKDMVYENHLVSSIENRENKFKKLLDGTKI